MKQINDLAWYIRISLTHYTLSYYRRKGQCWEKPGKNQRKTREKPEKNQRKTRENTMAHVVCGTMHYG